MTKIGKIFSSSTSRLRRGGDGGGDGAGAGGTPPRLDGGAPPDGAPPLPRRTRRRTPQQLGTMAQTPPNVPPRGAARTAAQLAAMAANPPTLPQRPAPDPARQNLINAVRTAGPSQTVNAGTQTGPMPPPVVIHVQPARPTMVNASTQTEPPPQAEKPKGTDFQTQAGGSKVPRRRPVTLNTDVWREVARSLADDVRGTGGPNPQPDADSLQGLTALTLTSKTLRTHTLHELRGLQIEQQLTGTRVDLGLASLLRLLGGRPTGQPGERTIRSLPATRQVEPLIELFRLASRTSAPTMSDSTRLGLAPALVETIGGLPHSQAAQVLHEGVARLHDIDSATTRVLLGQPGTRQPGTVQALPARRQLPILEFLADNWPQMRQEQAGLAQMIHALPEDMGVALKARFPT